MKRTSTGFEKANALYIYANKKNLFYILETEIQFKLVIYLKKPEHFYLNYSRYEDMVIFYFEQTACLRSIK